MDECDEAWQVARNPGRRFRAWLSFFWQELLVGTLVFLLVFWASLVAGSVIMGMAMVLWPATATSPGRLGHQMQLVVLLGLTAGQLAVVWWYFKGHEL